jgi:hypothetical protein
MSFFKDMQLVYRCFLSGVVWGHLWRCARCNYILKPPENPCPHCGAGVDWNPETKETGDAAAVLLAAGIILGRMPAVFMKGYLTKINEKNESDAHDEKKAKCHKRTPSKIRDSRGRFTTAARARAKRDYDDHGAY